MKWLESCNKGKVNNVNVKLIVEDHEDISIGTIVKVNLVANTTALQFKICSLGSQLEGGEEEESELERRNLMSKRAILREKLRNRCR